VEKTASEIAMVKKNVRLQEWERQIEEQKSSGLSVQEWCQQHSIKPKTYYYHLRKVREEFLRSGKSENTQAQIEAERAVVPILTTSSDRNITIEKNGMRITLPESISADILIAVVDKLC
jgi:DNA-binding CsgD family transcriptional regulator